jgi:hypothetical protein
MLLTYLAQLISFSVAGFHLVHPSGPLLVTVWGVLYSLYCDCPFPFSMRSLQTRLMSYLSWNP